MRTKSILLSAAVLAAGVASSMASAVYSVNVVGYINLTLYPGYNLLGNQLDVDGVDTIGTVFNNANPTPALIDGLQCLTYSATGFKVDGYAGTLADGLGFVGWYDNNTGSPSTNTIPPGKGFYLYNPYSTNVPLTIAGTVLQGTNSVSLLSGYSLDSVVVPQAVSLDTTATNNFPVAESMEYLQFTNTGHGGNFMDPAAYASTLADGLGFIGWYDTTTGAQVFPTPGVGQGFFIFNPGSTTAWTRFFQVQ